MVVYTRFKTTGRWKFNENEDETCATRSDRAVHSTLRYFFDNHCFKDLM